MIFHPKSIVFFLFCFFFSSQKHVLGTHVKHLNETLLMSTNTYRIRPNYHIVRIGFSKLLEKTCSVIYLIKTHFKESSAEECMHVLFNDAYAICFLISFIISYFVGTHLNCLDLSRQFE